MRVYVRVFVCHLTYVELVHTELPGTEVTVQGRLAEPVKPFFPYAIGECS